MTLLTCSNFAQITAGSCKMPSWAAYWASDGGVCRKYALLSSWRRIVTRRANLNDRFRELGALPAGVEVLDQPVEMGGEGGGVDFALDACLAKLLSLSEEQQAGRAEQPEMIE